MLEQNEPLICEDVQPANLRRLTASVVNQAVADLLAKRTPIPKRLEAFVWLTGPELEVWTDLDPYKLLPHLAEAKELLQYRRMTK